MKALLLVGMALCAASPVFTDTPPCGGAQCPQVFKLISVSEAKSYGLLLEAPAGDCRRVRYSIRTASARFLGHTPPLGPGEVAVVRMGRGFAEGDHDLTIAADGCAAQPMTTRRVTLAKTSPDHGWRAASHRFERLVNDR
jgi:hypothetical protein